MMAKNIFVKPVLPKGNPPCQAVHNNLYLDEIPEELFTLDKLEQILIVQRIVFEKIVIMLKVSKGRLKVQFTVSLLNVSRPVEVCHICL